ncbi:MAG: DNA translocase FtsK [Verrucomicrobia subdivision 3 bacterium]|nr:DNA translocase FtsK [Limisphaerales bacterium]MCS1417733.1 DNA translocase FtsK [Limisphaerales bacterium]
MNKLLTVGQSLSVVESLRRTINEVAHRESALLETRDRELEAIHRKYDLLKARFRRESEDEYRQALEAFEAEGVRIQDRNTFRKSWIDRAHGAALAALKESVEQLRSQQKYENQKDLLQANREHDADLQSSERTRQEFLQELQCEEQRFESLRNRAWRLFRGYAPLTALLRREREMALDQAELDEYAVLRRLREVVDQLETSVSQFSRRVIPRLFSAAPLWLFFLVAGGLVGGDYFMPAIGESVGVSSRTLLMGIGSVGLGVLVVYGLGFGLSRSRAFIIAEQLCLSRQLILRCQECVELSHHGDVEQVKQRLREIEDGLEQAWHLTDQEAAQRFESGAAKLAAQHQRLRKKHAWLSEAALDRHQRSRQTVSAGESNSGRSALARVQAEEQSLEVEVSARFEAQRDALIEDWRSKAPEWLCQLEESQAVAEDVFADWIPGNWANWSPPENTQAAARFANLEVNLKQLADRLPLDSRFDLDQKRQLTIPLVIRMPLGESLLFETEGGGATEVVSAMNTIMLRLLTTSPVGKMELTILDPVCLGQNFAGLMHLADYDEQMINRRIWTQASQIDRCLRGLTEHMEKVMQMYLRKEYETLADYNEAAGNIAEKYHFLVVADFPTGFNETAIQCLQSIAVSGPRCGVFLIIHRDLRQPLPDASVGDDLRSHCNWIQSNGSRYQFGGKRWSGVRLNWDAAPDAKLATEVIHKVGQASVDGNRVEVPFDHVVPKANEFWSLKTHSELRVPIGRTGASKLQYLTLGKGTQQHVLIAGKTGSGKSTLFHVIVTNLALWCRPDQVEFYLVDFKKGVEFKYYAEHDLAHARVVAIESDREFGLSVLERVDQELRRRGELFREHGVQDLAGYHRVAPEKPLPRTLVMIDEFQEYFVEDDHVSQSAAVLLDRIVRQGRAFGIHVILGSQTLGGAYTLTRTTFAQMVVRIALQCDEADSYLIMDENNAAPRLLSRPGEGIYNDSGGALEGNSPFQAVWLSAAERDRYLDKVRQLATEAGWEGEIPVVFEGNAPADVADNTVLAAALKGELPDSEGVGRAWLGAPNAIKGPTEAVFELHNGSNLLVIGQNEEMAFSLVLCSLISLATQYRVEEAQFVILEAIPDHSPQREILDRVIAMLPHQVRTLKEADLETLMGEVDQEMNRRNATADSSPAVCIIVLGLQSFKKLRPEDEFSFTANEDAGEVKPGEVFDCVVREGGSLGICVIATTDSYSSAQRFLSRKAMTEFEMRVLFQMSANDSAALIDSTKASQLGLHRALFYNERKGYLETFRPYALPGGEWLAAVETLLSNRPKTALVST